LNCQLLLQLFSIICPAHRTASAVPLVPPIAIPRYPDVAPAKSMLSIMRSVSSVSTRMAWEQSVSPTMVVLWIIPFAQIASVCVGITILKRMKLALQVS